MSVHLLLCGFDGGVIVILRSNRVWPFKYGVGCVGLVVLDRVLRNPGFFSIAPSTSYCRWSILISETPDVHRTGPHLRQPFQTAALLHRSRD